MTQKNRTQSTPIYLGAIVAIIGQEFPAWAAEQTNGTIAAVLTAGGGIATALGTILALGGAIAYWLQPDDADGEE